MCLHVYNMRTYFFRFYEVNITLMRLSYFPGLAGATPWLSSIYSLGFLWPSREVFLWLLVSIPRHTPSSPRVSSRTPGGLEYPGANIILEIYMGTCICICISNKIGTI